MKRNWITIFFVVFLHLGCSEFQSNYMNYSGGDDLASEEPIRVNLQKIKSISASSHDGNEPNNILDNDLNTRWSAEGEGEYVEVLFTEAHSVKTLFLAFFKGDIVSHSFGVEAIREDGSRSEMKRFTSSGQTIYLQQFDFETERAIGLRITGFENNQNKWNSYTEVLFLLGEPMAAPEPVKPVELAIVSTQSSSDDGNGSDNLIDGDFSTRWSANGSGQYVDLNLEMQSKISEIQLSFYKGDQRTSDFEVFAIQGELTKRILPRTLSSGESTELQSFKVDETQASTIRIVGYGNSQNSWNSITETVIIGTTTGVAPVPPQTPSLPTPEPPTSPTPMPSNGDRIVTIRTKTIKKDAITWTLDREYEVGQYINGDYFVVDSGSGVRVVAVSPAPSGGRNGSGVNVKAMTQPADSRALGYSAGISFPKVLKSGDALLSFKSTQGNENNSCEGARYRNQGGYCEFHSQGKVLDGSVLTVVDRALLKFSFRPPSLGDATNRKTFVLPNIDDIVRSLPQLNSSSLPDTSVLIRSRERYQFLGYTHWGRRQSAPMNNQATYAAYSRNPEVLLALTANISFDAKKKLLISVLQHGIEIYGLSRLTNIRGADGGHHTHMASVLAVTAEILKDTDMRNKSRSVQFSEKQMTYIGSGGKALWGRVCPSSPNNFQNMCSGNYQGGAKDCRDPKGLKDALDQSSCNAYQDLNGKYYPGQALAMILLGAVDDFNHQPFFEYTDRWMRIKNSTSSAFVTDMWNRYR